MDRYPDYDEILEWAGVGETKPDTSGFYGQHDHPMRKEGPATRSENAATTPAPILKGTAPLSVSEPTWLGNERAYILDAVDRRWLTQGEYVGRLERGIQEQTGRRFAIACNSGTAALHLAMLGLGLGPGDAVIVPALTYIATANAVSYTGATPIFVDVTRDTWCMDPADVARKIQRLKMTGGYNLRGAIAVHLYDAVADLAAIKAEMPDETWLVEDAAQAIGASYCGTPAGAWGDVGTFSFYGSKTITAGEGGAAVTDNAVTAEMMRLCRGQGAERSGEYEHEIIGYNYRMTDLGAAIAVAQLEKLEEHLARRRAIIKAYHRQLPAIAGLQAQETTRRGEDKTGAWAMAVILPKGANRVNVRQALCEKGIETRPFFVPLHMTAAYHQEHRGANCQIATHIAGRGLVLPTHAGMGEGDVARVVSALEEATRR